MVTVEALLESIAFERAVPTTLYHYTSARAFLSIIGTGRVWATHVKFLNDTTEAEWMWEAARQRLTIRKEAAKTEQECEYIARLLEMTEVRRSRSDFVASFSENGDDLGQWRAYCREPPGFSIGFSTAALRTQWIYNPSGGDPFFVGGGLKRVTYLDPYDLTSFDSQLEILVGHIAPALDGREGFDGKLSKEQFAAAWLASISSAFKHPAFRAEREWRLILSKPHKPMPGQQFRVGRSSLVPYVEVELNRNYKSEQITKQIIERVIVSPCPDPERAVDATKAFFLSLGQPEVQVLPSSIPYKNW